jgi:hypothetical protein
MNSEIEVESLLELLNHLFEHLENNIITDLSALSNEIVIKRFLIEVEPDIESISGKLDIVSDKNFPIRYSNMVLLVNAIDTYLQKCYEKNKLINKVPIKKLILINDLLKGEEYQIVTLIELIILMSALSTKKDYFLDRIGECDERLINTYLTYVEKYVPLEAKNDGNESLLNINSSLIRYNNFEGTSKILGVVNEKLNKKIEESEKEKNVFLKNINELENLLKEERKKNYNLEQKLVEMDLKFKDFNREIELVKSSNNFNKMQQQELMEESMMISQFKSDLRLKEIELQDKDREISQLNTFHSEEVKKLTERIEQLQEKISSSNDLNGEIDKLRNKVKELQVFKDKCSDYEEMSLNLDSKIRIIDSLIQEKQSLTNQLDKYSKEILNEKEKVRKKDYELKQLNIDLEELKKENLRLESTMKYKESHVSTNN